MRWARDCESLVLTHAWSIEMYANQIAVIDCCERFDMSSPLPNSQETKRIAGVIVTHGHLAGELLAAAEMIVGPISFITAVSIGWHDDVDAARDEVQRAITREIGRASCRERVEIAVVGVSVKKQAKDEEQ